MYYHGKAVCSYQWNSKQRPAVHDQLYIFLRSSIDTTGISVCYSVFNTMDLLQLHDAGNWCFDASYHPNYFDDHEEQSVNTIESQAAAN